MHSPQTPLVKNLNAESFDHPVARIEVVETHISWVVLTGPYAYKIKKPVDLGFLDFSDPKKRVFFCHEELRLNRRLAPELYLDVVTINGSLERPVVAGSGDVIDYAVKMVQFDREDELDRVLRRGELHWCHIDALAVQVAKFHTGLPCALAEDSFGEPDSVFAIALDNFPSLREVDLGFALQETAAQVRQWTESLREHRSQCFRERKRDGFVRECHGDMHLQNMLLHNGCVTIFDGIDFNPSLRWIDVMSEVAFTVMDLEVLGRRDLATRFLNAYLRESGDYGGLSVLRWYLVYRAMVRAKVAAIQAAQQGGEPDSRAALTQCARYLRLAARYMDPGQPTLSITCGLSGSGKSTCSASLAEASGAICVSSDIERKRIYGRSTTEPGPSEIEAGLYSRDATERTYGRLLEVAEEALKARFPVIVDASFLRREHRARFAALAEKRRVPFRILRFEVSPEELRRRVARRLQEGGGASDADLDVLEHQRENEEPLTPEELSQATIVTNSCGSAAPPGRHKLPPLPVMRAE